MPATATGTPARGSQAGSVKMQLDARPWAQVKIDGRSIGEVQGKKVLSLPAGVHRVEFVHPRLKSVREVELSLGTEPVLTFDAFAPNAGSPPARHDAARPEH